ncbi:unnamed protein product [Discosporangium mesarthrocarpum]
MDSSCMTLPLRIYFFAEYLKGLNHVCNPMVCFMWAHISCISRSFKAVVPRPHLPHPTCKLRSNGKVRDIQLGTCQRWDATALSTSSKSTSTHELHWSIAPKQLPPVNKIDTSWLGTKISRWIPEGRRQDSFNG